jgi:hypothetical protein
MNWMADHFGMVMGIGGVVVVALIGLLLFLRNKGED